MLDQPNGISFFGNARKCDKKRRSKTYALNVDLNCVSEANKPRAYFMIIIEFGLEFPDVLAERLEHPDHRILLLVPMLLYAVHHFLKPLFII